MTGEFDSKDVVITGATGGLGAAVVETLLQSGATCHVPILEGAAPEHATWSAHERVHVATGIDLTREDAVTSYYRGLPPLWASIHLVGGFAMAGVVDTSLDELSRMFTLNAQTCFLCCREATRAMRAHGRGGRMVNVTARPALEPVPGMLAYTVSKAAVAAMTRSLARELGPEGILVNAVVPSIIDTPANRQAMPQASFDKWPKPVDIAEAIEFLASPRNRLTSGCLVPVYGQA